MIALQLELFPSATPADKEITKTLLAGYRKDKALVRVCQDKGVDALDPQRRTIYNAALKRTDAIERAVRLIIDQEIREMIEYKYIQGDRRRHKDTVTRFCSWDQSTVGRKLNEGIDTIAGSIKLFM